MTRLAGLALVLLAFAGCERLPLSECAREGAVDVAPDEVTELGFSASEAAAHFTFVEDVVARERDGSPVFLRIEAVVRTGRTQFGVYVPASDAVTCPAGRLSVGELEVHLRAGDGSIDERLEGYLGVDQPLAMASAQAEAEVSFEDLSGTWVPDTIDFNRGPVAYLEVVIAGGELGAHVERIEIGGVTRCHPKGGCDHVPEILYLGP